MYMKNIESREYPDDFVAVIRDEIENVEALMQAEHERVPENDWLACFITRLSILSMAELAAYNKTMDADTLEKVKAILNPLIAQSHSLRRGLARGEDIPKETKQEMLSTFRSVLDVL